MGAWTTVGLVVCEGIFIGCALLMGRWCSYGGWVGGLCRHGIEVESEELK